MKKMAKKLNALFALIILLLIVAVLLLNAVALVLSNRYPLSADLTANSAYEIGDETKAVLDALTGDVTIDVLAGEDSFAGDPYLVQAKHILDQYPRYSSRVTLRYVDYASDPSYAAGHADLTLSEGDVIVSANEHVKQISLTSMFNYAYTASGSLTVESSRAEEAVTGAILNVFSGEDVMIGVLTGNGEQDMASFTALRSIWSIRSDAIPFTQLRRISSTKTSTARVLAILPDLAPPIPSQTTHRSVSLSNCSIR